MSKIIDSLRRLSKGPSTTIGFRPATLKRPAPMLLLVHLHQLPREAPEALVQWDMDGLLVGDGKRSAPDLAAAARVVETIPWGLWVVGKGEELAYLIEMGCDFVVMESSTAPVAILQEKRLGKLLAIEPSLADNMVRAVDALPVDAVWLRAGLEESSALTINHLLLCQRVALLLSKPLLVSISPSLGLDDLQGLVGVGVKGLIVKPTLEGAPATLQRLRQVIEGLAPVRREAPEVTLPRLRQEVAPPEEALEPE